MTGKGIKIYDLYKSFGSLEVLKGIDLKINDAGINAILGPNGSGKTTLIKCILGMVIPSKGTITFEGEDIKRKWQYRDRLSYLPQIARFPDNLRVSEVIRLVSDLRNRENRSAYLIDYLDLHPFMNKKLRKLSGGTRQKVNLVLALMYDNPVLILDEPTAGLDPITLIKLKDLLRTERDRGKTILINTHIINFVDQLADNIVFILEGKIYFQGSPSELKSKLGEDDLEHAIAGLLQEGKLKEKEIETPKGQYRPLFGRKGH